MDRDSQTVVCDEMLEDLDNIEELRDTLPEHQPRSWWIVLSYSVLVVLFKNIKSICLCLQESFLYQVCGLHKQVGQL